MNRTLGDWIGIVNELQPVYARYEASRKAGKTNVDTVAPLVAEALGVLEKHQVTIGELKGIVTTAGPLLALF